MAEDQGALEYEFTVRNLQHALVLVFTRAATDFAYRELCLRDPRAAFAEVSTLRLPDNFKFNFVTHEHEILHSYFLPPFVEGEPSQEQVLRIIRWCSHHINPTTQN